MPQSFRFSVTLALWPRDAVELRAVRALVFIDEQKVPPGLEWDGRDDACVHVVARDGEGRVIGTGRLLPEGRIGRMAVLREARGKGVGAAILRELLALARQREIAVVELGAQTHAIGFYEKCGFVVISEEYLDAGIAHRTMRLDLND